MTDPDHVIPFERLPEKLAESSEGTPAEPVTPLPAATIVLLRDAEDGLQVLLLRRNRSAGFVPGAYVFAGGRVDASDAAAAVLKRVDGLTPEDAASRLDLVDADPPAIAYYLAALREAFEETGILVGLKTDGSAPATAAEDADTERIRNDVMEDRIDFAEALGRMECRIAGGSVEYLAHWITPEPEPRRYDTRFFAARVRAGAAPIVDPREMSDALWITPTQALRETDRGRLPMVFPTTRTLEQLADYPGAAQALRALARREVRTVKPTLVVARTGGGKRPRRDD